ncbi:unnamed protein product [Microthlaspi erraticum]|uniref:Uncharacterized protein n=1 Tax=Microthlaspi erraticum TaxID=1685480 RepID=A0A6D2JDU6_9BRAS|nr:unnamed protein product [Microthlaspi erraticum]
MDFIKTSSLHGSIENQRPTAQSGWPRNDVPRSAKFVRPSEVSAKVQNHRPITHHDPGNYCPRSATPQPPRHAAHDTPHDREITPRVRPRFHRPNLIRPTTPADRESSGHDRSDSATTRLSGRSSRPTVPTPRSTRSPF